jgi:asparagine synthase (glutamine-hydrolysing)
MCGIAGFSGFKDPALLNCMSEVMRHRGPDDKGTWANAEFAVGLAHRRLSIIDVDARGQQPMWDASSRIVIAFNGEIYNYRDLRRDLVADGYVFRTETDTEVIINLWLQRGRAALGLLEGMFAFALWDSRNRTMTLARDPFGVKPLYVAELPSAVIFGSEVKSLLQVPEVSRSIDSTALVHHLMYLWSPGPRTVLSGVKKLAPGTWMDIVDGEVVGSGSFRKPMPTRTGVIDAPTEIRSSLVDAVRSQLVADVPIGAFLSGGIDSTTIVALARQEVPEFDCFTIAGDAGSFAAEGFSNDIGYARQAAKALGVRLHVAEVNANICDDVDFMIHHLDEPQADLAPLQVYLISALARSMGVKVLLSGAGGDDLFGGYRRHVARRLERYWTWAPERSRIALQRLTQFLPASHPSPRRLRKLFSDAEFSGDVRAVNSLHWLNQEPAMGLLTAEFKASINPSKLDGESWRILGALPDQVTDLSKLMALDEQLFLVDHNLNYTDKMSMAAGVEVRVPFMDSGVVGLAHRLSDDQLVRGLTAKWALREAVRGLIPDAIIDRPKAGFGVPLRQWIAGPLAPWIQDQLSPLVIRRRGIFDSTAIQRLLTANAAGRIDGSYTILSVAIIERWMQLFVDSVPGATSISRPSEVRWKHE